MTNNTVVTVKLFGLLKTLTNNQSEVGLELSAGRQVKDLTEALNTAYPRIGDLIQQRRVLISVNQEIAHPETEIKDGDEVALLPPFAGGARI